MTAIQREIEQECVPYWRYFKDPAKQKDYVQYRRHSLQQSTAFSIFLGIATLGTVIILIKDFSSTSKHLLQPSEALCRIRILSGAFLRQPVTWSLVASSLCGFDLDAIYTWVLKKLGLKNLVGYTFYADVVILVTSYTISLMILAQSASGACPDHPPEFSLRNIYCNPGASLGFLPTGPLLVQAVGLSFFHVALKGSCWFVILFSFLMELISVLVSSYLVKGTILDIMILFPFLWKYYILNEYENQLLRNYIWKISDEKLMKASLRSENEKTLAEMQATEIRYLVANTAHDLKTPLQAIGMGADEIQRRLNSLHHRRSTSHGITRSASGAELVVAASAAIKLAQVQTETDTSRASPFMRSFSLESKGSQHHYDGADTNSINDSVKDMYVLTAEDREDMLESTGIISATVAFMAMTINRAIDFTKASHDIKLVPSYETVKLEAVLSWPASIIRSLQNRISIEIDAVPKDICPFVITDKGWLTENLLCLFSNAIKYSTGGTVTVHASLVGASTYQKQEQNNNLKIGVVEGIITETTSTKSNNDSDCGAAIDTDTRTSNDNTGNNNFHVRIDIEDTGIGIPDETKSRLFAPFQQAQRMATGGTGLGLYSLRKRIEALGGMCGVADRLDGKQGSRFWFTFPYRPDEASAEAEHLASSVQTSLSSTVNNSGTQTPAIPPADTKPAAPSHSGSIPSIAVRSRPGMHEIDELNKSGTSDLDTVAWISGPGLGMNSTVSGGIIKHATTPRSGLRDTARAITSATGTERPLTPSGFVRININTPAPIAMSSSRVGSASNSRDGSGRNSRAPSRPSSRQPSRQNSRPPSPLLIPHHSPISSTISAPVSVPIPVHIAPATPDKNTALSAKALASLASNTSSLKSELSEPKKVSVLLVDDSISILKMTSKSLVREGFVVTTAENGSIALNILKERAAEFDVVLLDLQMPVMDGLEMTRRFRSQESEKSVDILREGSVPHRLPIIGMSANSDEETRRQALEVGMDQFIPKPFNIDKFKGVFSIVK